MQGVHSIRIWPHLPVDGNFKPLECDFWKVLSSNSACSRGSQKSLSFSEKWARHSTRSSVEDKVSKTTDHIVKIWPKAKAFDLKLLYLCFWLLFLPQRLSKDAYILGQGIQWDAWITSIYFSSSVLEEGKEKDHFIGIISHFMHTWPLVICFGTNHRNYIV